MVLFERQFSAHIQQNVERKCVRYKITVRFVRLADIAWRMAVGMKKETDLLFLFLFFLYFVFILFCKENQCLYIPFLSMAPLIYESLGSVIVQSF